MTLIDVYADSAPQVLSDAADAVAYHFDDYVSFETMYQEAWLWRLRHPQLVSSFLDKEQPDVRGLQRVVESYLTSLAREERGVTLGYHPDYEQFCDCFGTEQKIQDGIGSASTFYNYLGRPYDPGDVVVIVHSQYVNVARQHINGIDLSASDRFGVGMGALTLRGSATWLDSTQQNSATQAPYDVAGTLFNPARFNARAGAVWGQGGLSTSVFANYRSGVTDRLSGRTTASFTTFDAALRYATDRSTGAMSGIEVALSAQNLLNRRPPSYVVLSPDQPPYDSTNYSAIGRFVSLSVSKRW